MDSSDPIADYFARYPGFDYDPTRSPAQELKRMCRDLGFLPNTYERANARDEFNIALALKFNRDFGSDVDSLEAWQALCMRIQVDPIPETLSECRRVSLFGLCLHGHHCLGIPILTYNISLGRQSYSCQSG